MQYQENPNDIGKSEYLSTWCPLTTPGTKTRQLWTALPFLRVFFHKLLRKSIIKFSQNFKARMLSAIFVLLIHFGKQLSPEILFIFNLYLYFFKRRYTFMLYHICITLNYTRHLHYYKLERRSWNKYTETNSNVSFVITQTNKH